MIFSYKQNLFGIALLGIIILPEFVFAKIGVGVGIGKIQVDEQFKAGQIYQLPSLPVLNTGDELADYEVSVEYHEGVPQLRPAREWFSFKPAKFPIEPGKIQNVEVILTLPLKVQPGEYFAYLEARPIKKSGAGVTSVGIAAAAKLYFTVAPANILEGIYYRIVTFIAHTAPWSWIILVVVVVAIIISILRRFISFNIGINFKRK